MSFTRSATNGSWATERRLRRARGARRAPGALCGALLAAALAACAGTRTLVDPTVEIHTAGGRELGVATDYGVVFLGRTARSGAVQLVAWYGDGPSIEASVIEPLGGGLYTAETEILLPEVGMDFQTPRPGTELLVLGRRGDERWETTAVARADPRVEGILLEPLRELRDSPGQVGAGVFTIDPAGRKQLVGLVSGRLRLAGEGGERDYLTVVGPEDLWRLVTYRRDLGARRRWVYRDDIL